MLVLCCLTNLYGQSVELRGIILDDADDAPVAGATIQLKNAEKQPLNYTFTRNDGTFAIKYDPSLPNLTVHIQSMGFRPQTFVLQPFVSPLTIRLHAEPTRLRDVTVKAPDIEQRSDTLVYYTSKYAQKQDRTIGDVLKRLPGVEVDDNGTIKYNGEPINKFYINGSDFADGRYNLATDNISPSDVASIEVMENHQPIRVLNGLEFSQQAGLNIKLKEEARQRWIGIANGGIGVSPCLYDASLFAMRIAGKWQNMESIRMNDTGWNPASQSTLHTEDRLFGSIYQEKLWQDFISLAPTSAPLDERRTRDNQSFLANTTNAWHIGRNYDAKLNITYSGDRLDFNMGSYTEYLDSDIPSFTLLNTMRTQTHRVNGHLSLQTNSPAMYLKENLYVDADWNHALSQIDGTQSLIQNAKTPSLRLTHDLQLLKRIGNRLLTLSSRNRYTRTPQSLGIDAENKKITQNVLTNDFRTITELRYGWILGKWNVYARSGIDFDLHHLKTNLTGLNIDYPTIGNDNLSMLNVYLSPETSYKSMRWQLTLSMPVSYRRYVMDNYLSAAPTFFARYQLNAKTNLTAHIKYAFLPTEPSQYVSQTILGDYRNLYAGYPIHAYAQERSATFAVKYRNPLSSFFANLSAQYECNYSPLMSNQLFVGEQILTTYAPMGNDTRRMQMYGELSKGLHAGKIILGADLGYTQLRATAMRQDMQCPYMLKHAYVCPYVKGNFAHCLSADYRLSYIYKTMSIDNVVQSSLGVLKQNMTLTFLVKSDWQLSLVGEHYYTHFYFGYDTHLLLFDASARWNVSKRIELGLTATNLLNKRNYRYATYGMLSETTYNYFVRGRNILASFSFQL